ncbi:hypothetical protein Agub_g6930 [Astrephomene gubernaculifera]|uniref:TOG domain-containing protein n=1 Tax=Astrephomene gubernaculifera TaxID=47775 RepID=A0AAD3DRZ9_9CHLO|nr:hypothetical protein Agub_g6930 [Astrephomene gubernaculifera]
MSAPHWSDIKEDLLSSSKQRLSGLESLETLLKQTSLDKTELGELLDLSPSLLSDSSSKVAQQTLEALGLVILRADTSIVPYINGLVPCVAERLGDSRQPVRTQALQVLVALCKALKPELVLDKFSSLWQHKNWKVKQGLLDVIAEVVSTVGASFLGGRDQNNALLKQVVRMLEDPDMVVREAAQGCLKEICCHAPAAVANTIQSSNLRPAVQREALSRLDLQTETTMADVAVKRSSGGVCAADSSTDYSAPLAASSGRVSSGGLASSSAPARDTAAPRQVEARRQSAANAGPSQPPAAPPKRGGFKDGGGVTLDGDLPPAAPIPITSERDLRAELEAATATLAKAPDTEWQDRMEAMQRVEGLVLGGALEYECFYEAMKGLAQVLTQQFKERRSTIARQACHLIGVLARALGPRFEPHALTLMPTLFGVLVITVAVMAESADMGMKGILRHCQAPRVLQVISDGLCKEKNPKTRQFCAGYLVLILEEWDVGVWGRSLDPVEVAIRAGAQDSNADTRQSSRTAMALYNSALPDRAQAFLKRLDSGLQDKLASGLGVAKPAKPAAGASRQSLSAAIAANKRRAAAAANAAGESDILVVASGPVKREPAADSQPNPAAGAAAVPRPRGPSRTSSAGELPPAEAQVRPAAAPAPPTASRPSRKSIALPPGRIPGGSADLTSLLGESSGSGLLDPSTQARVAALRSRRVSAVPFEPVKESGAARIPPASVPPTAPAMRLSSDGTGASRVPCPLGPEQQPNRLPTAPAVPAASASARSVGTWQADRDRSSGAPDVGANPPGASSGHVPLSRVISAIYGGPRSWSDKVEALSALAAHVRASVPGAGETSSTMDGSSWPGPVPRELTAEPEKVAQSLERVRERLLEALEDPHQKVLSSALSLFADVVRYYGRVMEAQLDRLLPVLLNKGAEQKEQSKSLCAEVLAECGKAYRHDLLIPALTKCLDVVKPPRGKQMALEFFRAHLDQWGALNATQLKHWLVRLAPLLDDRAPELRKRASDVMDALMAAPWAREPINYVAYQHNNADVGPLRRYLNAQSSHVPAAAPSGIGSELGGFGSAQPHLAVAGAPPAATNDSRRQLPSAAPAAPVQIPAQPAPQPSSRWPGQAPGGMEDARQAAATPPADGYMVQPGISMQTQQPGRTYAPGAQPSQTPPGQGPGSAAVRPPYVTPPGPNPAVTPPVASYTSQAYTGHRLGGAAITPSPLPRRPLQIPQDPNSQQLLLTQLLDSARAAVGGDPATNPGASMDQQTSAMEQLADAVEGCGRDAWVRMFPLLMVEISAWVQHPTRQVRTMSFGLLKELLVHQPQLFTDNNLESQVMLLLHGSGDAVREVSMYAGQAMRALLALCNGHQAMLLLQLLLPRERDAHRRSKDKGMRLIAVLDGIRQLAARLDRSELRQLTFNPHPETGTTLLESLVPNLGDPETSVRRGVVVTLADLWFRLGHGVRDVLQVLAGQSFNLLCIYYLKLHNVTITAGEQNPTEHPLVLGSGA